MRTTSLNSPERMRELGAKSAQVRKARWELRRSLKGLPRVNALGAVADVIETPRPEFDTVRADDMLAWLGKGCATRCLVAAHVAPYRTIGELSDRQRAVICERLRGEA